nr:trypsin-like peptidase domain-containing protein [Streptomyces phaeofaciens]
MPLAVVQVLAGDGRVVGAGFLAGDGVVVTCAHVVRAADGGPGGRVEVRFPHLPQAPVAAGTVLTAGAWRAPEAEDVAAVRLESVPLPARPAPLGSAAGCRGHRVFSFGFPAQAPERGHFGYGAAGDLLPADGAGTMLQLTQANDLTTGFSGGPVVDEVTGLVVGMVTAITAPDAHHRGLGIAYATPAEVLREVVPGLAEQQVFPYRGLEPFSVRDAAWFHGRGAAVDSVLEALRRHRLVLLLGPSGAGKSSLVQAGVLPALTDGRLPGSDRWLPLVARPGQDLPAGLEHAGLLDAGADGIGPAVERRLAAEPDRDRLVVVIDQFEELLTRPPAPDGRPDPRPDAVRQLTEVAAQAPVSVVMVMRDDFYPRLAALFPQLLEAATPGLVNIPAALGVGELHDIITRPAQDAGARIEDGLPERVIEDLRAADPDRNAPATLLPPLQLALHQLWERRVDGRLTHQAYQQIGEVTGILAAWCNNALDRLPAEHRPTARRLLTALVRPADEAHAIPATRQQVPLDRLRALAADPQLAGHSADAAFTGVLAALTRDRIIITGTASRPDRPGEPMAELIHDALLRDWGDLREWIARDHRFQTWLHRVTDQNVRHIASGLPADLLAGTDLAEGLEWARQRPLPTDIAAFLTASSKREQATVRRTRRLNAVLAGMLALALVAAGLALWQRGQAIDAREAAVVTQHQAESRQLAAQSRALLKTDPDLASLLAVQAYRISHTDEAAVSLFDAGATGLKGLFTGVAGVGKRVAFAPDGRTLAIVANHTVRLWDTATGERRADFSDRIDWATGVTFSPDGKTLVTTGGNLPQLWNAATGEQRDIPTGHMGFADSAVYSPDGKVLATVGLSDVRLWDMPSGRKRHTLNGNDGSTETPAFSPDGKTLATTGENGTVTLWDTATGRQRDVLTGHKGRVNSVAFSPDGRTLATAGLDSTLRMWDPATGRHLGTLSLGTWATSAVFSPDGRTLATAGRDEVVRLWDTATYVERGTLTGHEGEVDVLAFSADGRTLASAGRDKTVRLWDTTTGAPRLAFTAYDGHTVHSAAYSPDGKSLATAGYDGVVQVWDTATGVERGTLTDEDLSVNSVAYSPNGKTLATAGSDGVVRVWDTATGEERDTLSHEDHSVRSVAYSPDGGTLATGDDDGTVRLWDTATGTERDTLTGHKGSVTSVVFSPDGKTLATSGEDGTARLWDTATGTERHVLKGHDGSVEAVAFSPDGRTLAGAGSDEAVRLWDATTGAERSTLTGHNGVVSSVAFSPDGKTLASTGEDKTVRLWDTATGAQRYALLGHRGFPSLVVFSPDGRTLASAGDGGEVRVWNVALPDADDDVRKICQALGRDFTRAERSQYLKGLPMDPVCPAAASRGR